ncbi:MAG: hypothetical protein Q4F60_01845 [Candidatus Saccharibacteria bacterium]|nr:hypothetical protein [Candidatus Saccharibacteria bacterium]
MKNNHKYLSYFAIANSNHRRYSNKTQNFFANSAIAKTKHKQYRTKLGFTIAELSLATAFISVLLITIAILIVHLTSTFQKGITMKSVDTMGQSLSDNFSRTIAASRGGFFQLGEGEDSTKYHQVWQSENPVTITNTSGRTFNNTGNVPTHGEFRTGDYTYIWNTGYVLDENKDIYKDDHGNDLTSQQVKVIDQNDKQYTNFRLLRVKGNCLFNSETKSYPECDTPVELLPASESALAIYDLQIFSAAYDVNTQHAYVSGSFILGTVRGGININTNSNFCTDAPSGLTTDFSYCAVNKFSFGTRTGIRKDDSSDPN